MPQPHTKTPVDETTWKLIDSAKERWEKLKKNETFDDWLAIGYALEAGSRDIMREHKVQQRIGAKWNKPWGAWLNETGMLNVADASARSCLLQIMDSLAAVQAWREGLSERDRLRWNHPQVVWQRFSGTRRGRSEDRRINPLEVERDKLQEELRGAQQCISEMESEIAELREEFEWQSAAPGTKTPASVEPQTAEAVWGGDLDREELERDRDAWKARATKAEAELAELKERMRPGTTATRAVYYDWGDAGHDYLIRVYNEDPKRSMAELARLCSAEFGVPITDNQIKGALKRLRDWGRIQKRPIGDLSNAA